MNYKVKKVLEKNRKYFITFLVIWVLMEILMVSPLAVSISKCTINGKYEGSKFFETLVEELSSLTSFQRIFTSQTFGMFEKVTLYMTIGYLLILTIGLVKSKPKNEYTDIEHGSSDWSEDGAQYRVLSKNNGIILAEHNYLPVDKPGNVNVLIVGRFWCR